MSDMAGAYIELTMDGQVRQFPLEQGDAFYIGRSDKSNIVIADDRISRYHAMVQYRDDDQFYITDMGSRNGTYVNGSRISAPVMLQPGDELRIGNQELKFHRRTVTEAAPKEDLSKSTNILFTYSLVTVLVADIRDFTGLAQRVEASKLSRISGTLFRESGKILHERGAWAQKYIGDAVMAIWLHKKRAPGLRELIAILNGLAHLAEIAAGLEIGFELDAPVRIGAGINTGWASVGNVGSTVSADHTALGDVVNKAFRLEAATRDIAYDLALGEETHGFLHARIDTEKFMQAHDVKLKGYEGTSKAYATQLSSLAGILEALHRCDVNVT